jgi:hypothetical protein
MKENNNEKNNDNKKNANLEDKKTNSSNLNATKFSNGSGDFRELNKEIFQIIQQGGNISGLSITNSSLNNNSINLSNQDNSNKKISLDLSSNNEKNIKDDSIKKKINENNLLKSKIETINIKDTIISNLNNDEKLKNNNLTEQNFDEVPNEIEKINQLHFQECKTNNLSNLSKMDEMKSNYIYPSYEKRNFIPKANFTMVNNNTINYNENNNNNNNQRNNTSNNNNINTNTQNFIYYPQFNNYYYFSYMFPQNAFTYNNNNINHNEEESRKNTNKKKFKDKFEQTLFTINLEQIIKGNEKRTTIMIRHIPNKYSTDDLLNEIDYVCKGKYDFFYLPLDPENNCNLGYSFINFIDPLHIIYFYHSFKSRKWNCYKSHKECDLSFAKFQGKIELTAHLEKNINKMEDKKKLPMLFNINNPPKIDLPKDYLNIIKSSRPDILEKINFID